MQRVEVELARQRLADLVDRGELGQPLTGLVDQADVLEGHAEAGRQGRQELDVGLAEGVLAVDVLERDHAADLVADARAVRRAPDFGASPGRSSVLPELGHAGQHVRG